MEKVRRLNPEDWDGWEDSQIGQGGGGGGGKKKDKHQGEKTVDAIDATAKQNQLEKKVNTGNRGEKTPKAEVQEVLDYVKKADEGLGEKKSLLRYVDWLKVNINSIDELRVEKSELGEMEQMTATLGAGGGGKDTSRNARRGTHLLTGITAKAQDDRRAEGNVDDVMEKITEALRVHLRNWKTIMMVTQTRKERARKAPVDLEKLEREVWRRAS